MALHGNLDCHGYPGRSGSVCGSMKKLTHACASVLLATPAPAGGEPPVPGPGALGTWQNRPANSALLRFAPWHRQIQAGVYSAQPATMLPGPGVGAARFLLSRRSVCRRPGPGDVPRGAAICAAASATGVEQGQPRRSSPRGLWGTRCARSCPCATEGLSFSAGAEAKGWGTRETAVPGFSHQGCRLGLHHAGLCREPEAAVLAGSHL